MRGARYIPRSYARNNEDSLFAETCQFRQRTMKNPNARARRTCVERPETSS